MRVPAHFACGWWVWPLTFPWQGPTIWWCSRGYLWLPVKESESLQNNSTYYMYISKWAVLISSYYDDSNTCKLYNNAELSVILSIISTSRFYDIQYFKVVTQKLSVPGALLPDTWPQPPCYCGRPVYGHRPWSWYPTPWLTRPSHRSATHLSWGGDPWSTQHSGDHDSAWWSKIGKIIKTHFIIQWGVRITLIMQMNS